MIDKDKFLEKIQEYKSLGIENQIDYNKFYLYSLITHSTAIEGSTITEIENEALFDKGLSAKGRTLVEEMMNLDLKDAYSFAIDLAKKKTPLSTEMLCDLSAKVMRRTGSIYNTLQGSFDSSKGELRKVNVTAGSGGKSYLNPLKVPTRLKEFCERFNELIETAEKEYETYEKYLLSFDAHLSLVSIHPWVDGNGRMARLIMNYLQFCFGLIPTKVNKANRVEYIAALNESQEKDSLLPFRMFMTEEHYRSLTAEIEAFKKSNEREPIFPELEL